MRSDGGVRSLCEKRGLAHAPRKAAAGVLCVQAARGVGGCVAEEGPCLCLSLSPAHGREKHSWECDRRCATTHRKRGLVFARPSIATAPPRHKPRPSAAAAIVGGALVVACLAMAWAAACRQAPHHPACALRVAPRVARPAPAPLLGRPPPPAAPCSEDACPLRPPSATGFSDGDTTESDGAPLPAKWWEAGAEAWTAAPQTEAEFRAAVQAAGQAGGPALVLVDFFATWCKGPWWVKRSGGPSPTPETVR